MLISMNSETNTDNPRPTEVDHTTTGVDTVCRYFIHLDGIETINLLYTTGLDDKQLVDSMMYPTIYHLCISLASYPSFYLSTYRYLMQRITVMVAQ